MHHLYFKNISINWKQAWLKNMKTSLKAKTSLNYSPERRRKNWEERIVDLNFSPQKKQSRKKTLEKAVASVDPAAISIQAQMSLLRFLPTRVYKVLEFQNFNRILDCKNLGFPWSQKCWVKKSKPWVLNNGFNTSKGMLEFQSTIFESLDQHSYIAE